MNADEIRAVGESLRSLHGKYTYTRGAYHRQGPSGDDRFCAMGALMVANGAEVRPRPCTVCDESHGVVFQTKDGTEITQLNAMEAAGLRPGMTLRDPVSGNETKLHQFITNMNDSGWNFGRLGKYMSENAEEMATEECGLKVELPEVPA